MLGLKSETNSSHLKMDGWNTSFLLRMIFRGELVLLGSVNMWPCTAVIHLVHGGSTVRTALRIATTNKIDLAALRSKRLASSR